MRVYKEISCSLNETFKNMRVVRTKIKIKPDRKRVLLRPFSISPEERVKKIIKRILDLSEKDAGKEIKKILKDFEGRHQYLQDYFLTRYEQIMKKFSGIQQVNENKKLLIGAYFTNEYSVEAASLFNPSMFWSPDQSDMPEGNRRFILSLRATGEGHISSIVFISGIISKNNNVTLEKRSKYVTNPQKIKSNFSKDNSTYEIEFSEDIPLSARVIFPYSPAESNGIEDARFVEFHDDNDDKIYYATYTAYDGKEIHLQLLETKDFCHFKINSLTGLAVKNKGMALFPRKIGREYVIISRQDNENIYIMFSKNLYSWDSKKIIMEPAYPWEFVQLGNCGSPIETDEGWLVLSHGVGAARKYSIGAFLLNKDDPSKVMGRLKKPLLSPNKNEREGYVPNVLYSCGGVINNGELIIPYAMSDQASSFAKVNLNELLTELKINR